MCQLALLSSPAISSMREHLPVRGPPACTTCAGGPRCRAAGTSLQSRSLSCSLAISPHSLPTYETEVVLRDHGRSAIDMAARINAATAAASACGGFEVEREPEASAAVRIESVQEDVLGRGLERKQPKRCALYRRMAPGHLIGPCSCNLPEGNRALHGAVRRKVDKTLDDREPVVRFGRVMQPARISPPERNERGWASRRDTAAADGRPCLGIVPGSRLQPCTIPNFDERDGDLAGWHAVLLDAHRVPAAADCRFDQVCLDVELVLPAAIEHRIAERNPGIGLVVGRRLSIARITRA